MVVTLVSSARTSETRIPMVPRQLDVLVKSGAEVFIESGLGQPSGYPDHAFEAVGCHIVYNRLEALARGDLILCPGRLSLEDLDVIQSGSCVMGLLHRHLGYSDCMEKARAENITLIPLEEVQDPPGHAVLRSSFAHLAGALLPQVAGTLLQSGGVGGFGTLIPALPGFPSAEVVIVGAGCLGITAARVFAGVGTQVTLIDHDASAIKHAYATLQDRVQTRLGGRGSLKHALSFADIFILAARDKDGRAPLLVQKADLKHMRKGSLLVDMAIDQGGNAQTSRPMGHPREAEIIEGIIHFAMPNLSSLVARRASQVFSVIIMPWVQAITRAGGSKGTRFEAFHPGAHGLTLEATS